MFGSYLIFGLPILYCYRVLYTGPELDSKAVIALHFLPKLPGRFLAKLRHPLIPFFEYEKTRVAFLATLIKLFFFPLMVTGVISNGSQVIHFLSQLPNGTPLNIWLIYSFSVSALLLVDTSIFAFGYVTESVYFKNEIKSVEPTLAGWMVALLSYNPFNMIFRRLERAAIPSILIEWITFSQFSLVVLLGLSIFCYGIYVWASIALGPRAGNLVNRGIVQSGPYAFVRHPAYISKNLAWWFALIPVVTDLRQIILLCISGIIYLLRAVTEERHLNNDAEYRTYRDQVKYRFIPFIS